jgi:hypothetical protein
LNTHDNQHIQVSERSEMLKFLVLFLFLLLLSGTDARGTRRRRRSSYPPRQTCVSPPAKCLANQVRDPRGGACTCRPGMIPHPTQNKCVTCPVGTVSKGDGATVCDPCPGSLIPNPQGSGCLSKFHYELYWYLYLIRNICIVLFISYMLLPHDSFKTRATRIL